MFNLERLEKGIAAFLISALVLGSGLSAYKKSHSFVNVNIENFEVEENSPDQIDDDLSVRGKAININEAGIGDLMKLKGVGKTLAERIVDYRALKGYFAAIEDIKNVKGIGEALFTKIKDDVSIE